MIAPHNRRFAKEFHFVTIIDKILTGDSAGDESEVEQVTAFLGRTLALIKAAEKMSCLQPYFLSEPHPEPGECVQMGIQMTDLSIDKNLRTNIFTGLSTSDDI